jgi:hypothetical protein
MPVAFSREGAAAKTSGLIDSAPAEMATRLCLHGPGFRLGKIVSNTIFGCPFWRERDLHCKMAFNVTIATKAGDST